MLKNLKSLFVITEESPQPENKTVKNDSPTSPTSGTSQIKAEEKRFVDNAILDRLLQALDDNNQPGFDYLEYRRSLKSLAALPMEEAVKFQSAFATASTMDVTLEKLLKSIDFYKKVLQIEHDNFSKASKEQYTHNVEGRQKEKENLANTVREKSQMIQKLTEEIRSHQIKMDELDKVIESADNKIRETTENFNTALQVILSQMEADESKLKQYIK